MKTQITTLILVAFLLCAACEDEAVTEPLPSENHISLITDEGTLNFTEDVGIFNSYIIGSKQDQLSLVLQTPDGLSCEIFILSAQLLEQTFPLSVPNAGFAYGEVQLRDYTRDVELTFGPNDDVNYVGYTSGDVRFNLTSYENDFLRGTVKGTISTMTGKSIVINEGSFGVFVQLEEVD